MFGQASLSIPQVGHIGPSRTEGLSDELALILGRTAAMTLSEQDGFVVVTLSDGQVKAIGFDTARGEVTIGRLVPSRDLIRRCGGFREFANNVVNGPLL